VPPAAARVVPAMGALCAERPDRWRRHGAEIAPRSARPAGSAPVCAEAHAGAARPRGRIPSRGRAWRWRRFTVITWSDSAAMPRALAKTQIAEFVRVSSLLINRCLDSQIRRLCASSAVPCDQPPLVHGQNPARQHSHIFRRCPTARLPVADHGSSWPAADAAPATGCIHDLC
jgi:hypothetical protein